MTRYAIDAPSALRLIRDPRVVDAAHQLVAPSALRSQVMSALYREVRDGSLDADDARDQLRALAELKARLLGDRVSRATAWRIAEQLDWPDPAPAEYLAVAVLQADALVTEDAALVAGAEGRVPIAGYEALFA